MFQKKILPPKVQKYERIVLANYPNYAVDVSF